MKLLYWHLKKSKNKSFNYITTIILISKALWFMSPAWHTEHKILIWPCKIWREWHATFIAKILIYYLHQTVGLRICDPHKRTVDFFHRFFSPLVGRSAKRAVLTHWPWPKNAPSLHWLIQFGGRGPLLKGFHPLAMHGRTP